MSSKWHQKKEKLRQEQEAREEAAIPDETFVKDQTNDAAMGKGEDLLFAKKNDEGGKESCSQSSS